MTAWSKTSRLFFVITGIAFLLVIYIEGLVFFRSSLTITDRIGFSILVDWASSGETNWNYLILIYLGYICSILGMVTAFMIGYDLRKSHGLKTLAIIVPSIIGFSLIFYSFYTLLEIPVGMVPYFNERTPVEAIPAIMRTADGIVYTSILYFSFGLIIILSIAGGFLFISERRAGASKYVNSLIGISAVVPATTIIVAFAATMMIANLPIHIYTTIWAIMTFIPLVLFSLWMLIQGAKGGSGSISEE